MGRLTTHVLDTARGKPAVGVRIDLDRIAQGGERQHLASTITNADGRADAPLLDAAAFRPGQYELAFHIGDYFRAQASAGTAEAFLDVVPVRFTIAGDSHYHVPLLVTPWSYATYRGS